MEIIVKRGEEQFGPYSVAQLKEQLASGVIQEDDWAWHEGLSDWVPAQTLVENSPPLASMPEPVTSSSVASTSSSLKAGIGKKVILAGAAILILGGGLAAAYFLGVFGGEEEPVAGEPDADNSSKLASSSGGAGEGGSDGGSSGGPGDSVPPPVTPPVSPPVAPPVAVDSSTSFNAVAQKLDAGGSFYFYLSTAQAQQWVRTTFTEGANLVKQMGGEAPPIQEDSPEALIGGMGAMIAQFAATGIEVGQAAYSGLGLDSIDGVGASTKDLGGDLKRNVSVVHHDPARGEGLLWKAFGEAPHELGALKLMPAETVMAAHGDLNLTIILQWVQAMVKDHGTPEMLGQLDTFLKSPPLLAVNNGYAGEMGYYMTFDPVKTIKVPVGSSLLGGGAGEGESTTTAEAAVPVPENLPGRPESPQPIRIPQTGAGAPDLGTGIPPLPSGAAAGQMIEIPEPGIIITMKVKDDSIQKMIEGVISALMPLQPVDLGGVTISQLPQPMPLLDLPIPLQPAMFQAGNYLVITSTPALAQKVIATHTGQSQGLKGTGEFQKMAQGVPLEGNQLIYVSGRVSDLSAKMFKESLATGMGDGLPKPVEEMLTKLMTMGSSAGLSVVQMQPDGMVMRTNTEGMGYDTVALAGAIAMPVAFAGTFWAAGSFAENLLGGSSDSFDGGFEVPMPEGFPSEAEGGSDPEGGEEGKASVDEPLPSVPAGSNERVRIGIAGPPKKKAPAPPKKK